MFSATVWGSLFGNIQFQRKVHSTSIIKNCLRITQLKDNILLFRCSMDVKDMFLNINKNINLNHGFCIICSVVLSKWLDFIKPQFLQTETCSFLFLNMCSCMCACMCMYSWILVPSKTRRAIEYPGSEITGGFGTRCELWELSPDPLKEWQMHLTSEPISGCHRFYFPWVSRC